MKPNSDVILAATVFVVAYGLIISEKINRTVVALAGGMVVLGLGVISQEQAIKAIDFNTIGLLVGMMIIVSITRRSGVFEFIAVKAVKSVNGDPWRIMLLLSILTAILSALLDNVTTVLLIVPVAFSIADELDLSPIPFLISEILASNIGGTLTLIGDPPNIMIGSATGLGFLDFVVNLFIPVIVTFIVSMILLKVIFRKGLVVNEAAKRKVMSLEEEGLVKDYALLKKSFFVLCLTILGFILHKFVHIESATIALSGATLLMLITKEEPEDILLAIEWPTIFFFVGLFIMVGALEHVGVIAWVAEKSLAVTGGALVPTAMLVLWLSAVASAFIDNIPFVATMIPLIEKMGQLGGIDELTPVWWALSLGACLGGNGTLLGASANVIVAGLAEKHGVQISFKGFMKIAFPLMILSICISSVYIYLRYLR